MSNITLSIDDDVLIKVKKLAVEQRTTLTGLVRGILQGLAKREDTRVEEAIAELRSSFDASSFAVADRTWTREDLHVR